MSESDEKINTGNIASRYGWGVLPYVEPIHPCAKDTVFISIYVFPYNYIKLTKYSCVLNCCSEFPVVFFPGAEINGAEYLDLPFIRFYSY